MQLEKGEKLYVQTLGTMEMWYDGKELRLEAAYKGKIMQLFLILIYAGKNGIGRDRLQDYLYDRHTTDSANALRVSVFRLRKILGDSPLPKEEYITNKRGIYSIGGTTAMDMDALQMEMYYKQAQEEEDEEKKEEYFLKVCSLYQGEFLPAMSGEFWVETMRSACQNIYIESIREVCVLLKKHKKYEKMLELCRQALELCPLEDWWEGMIEALLEMKRFHEAARAYHEAAIHLIGEEAQVTKEMEEWFRRVGRRIHSPEGETGEIVDILKEENVRQGAYRCTYLGFIDCFRVQARKMDTEKRHVDLIICTMLEGNGQKAEKSEESKKYLDILCDTVRQSLGKEDIYTRNGAFQVLALVSSRREKESQNIRKRIAESYRKRCGSKAEVRIDCRSLAEFSGKETLSEKAIKPMIEI